MKSEKIIIDDTGYNDDVLSKITDRIKNGKIVIMPSDTVYGFLTVNSNEGKLRVIKKRDKKPFLFLISSFEDIGLLGAELEDHQMNILKKFWPGKVTFILSKKDGTTIGVRMPDWEVLRFIIKESGTPLLSTSVNYSGENALANIENITGEFDDKVDLIVYDRFFHSANASTIVDLTKKPYKVLREGSVHVEF